MKPSHTIRPVFDDPNLVSAAGLSPVLRLAESAGLYALLDDLSVPSPNSAAKTASVVGGMLAGADSIGDLHLLRHGGMGRLFAGVRAPSTLGTFLRSFTHGHVQQLDKVGAGVLAGLTRQVPGLLTGAEADGIAFLDVDDTIREVHGHAKQGAAFGYSGVRSALRKALRAFPDVGDRCQRWNAKTPSCPRRTVDRVEGHLLGLSRLLGSRCRASDFVAGGA